MFAPKQPWNNQLSTRLLGSFGFPDFSSFPPLNSPVATTGRELKEVIEQKKVAVNSERYDEVEYPTACSDIVG